MKKILTGWVLLFLAGGVVPAYSQTLLPIDTAVFFTHIKFGRNIPKPLTACAGHTANLRNPYPSNMVVFSDSLTTACRTEYADLFTFLSEPFSHTVINTNDSGQILSVSLHTFFKKETDSANAAALPVLMYKRMAEQMQKRFGNPSRTDMGYGIDTSLLREWGRKIPLLAAWAGIYVFVTLQVQYGSSYDLNNWLMVDIRNQKFIDPPEWLKLAD